MEEMKKGKRYSAEDKGYTSKIYEIRWIPVTEREEYQEGPTRDALLKLKEKWWKRILTNTSKTVSSV